MAERVEEAAGSPAAPAWYWPRLFRPALLLMHVVVVLLFLATLQLGWWQWERAELRGWNVQNLSYAFQWPVYGLMGLWFHSRLMRMELERHVDDDEPGSSLVLYRPMRIDTSGDPDLAAYNAYLAGLNEEVLRQRRD